jgi:DNA-binding NtrC family response regulator
MREVMTAAEDVAVASTTVLISGESGTGKEVLSRYIHQCSARARGPWVAINCAALPAELLEGELFGHERGAFTGATERRLGRIELADKGTLLLDEISELPLTLQAKLLRVLQEREVDRVGGRRPIPVDVRIIATSNRSLAEMVAAREFRTDLYYRLNVFPIVLPPLRERVEDIPALAEELLRVVSDGLGRSAPVLSADALVALGRYTFPGNVRELGNILERALVRCRRPVLGAEELDLPTEATAPAIFLPPMFAAAKSAATSLAASAASGSWPSSFRSPGAAATAPSGGAHGHPGPDLGPDPGPDLGPDMGRDMGRDIGPDMGRDMGPGQLPEGLPLDLGALERLAIAEALRRDGGNRTHAARRLGISVRTLRNKLAFYRHHPDLLTSTPETPPTRAAGLAGRQLLPGTIGPVEVRVRSATLARPSQSCLADGADAPEKPHEGRK